MHPHIHHPPPHQPPSYHNYGTRIRKNSILKPSARLRQCSPSPLPAPRRIKPVPSPPGQHPVPLTSDPCFPVFPLPGVMLHPEDASNKVFHAIGRSFLSVDNRAMTIKDLAEMTLNYGLMCQNVSAASQAITTYIRNHMARCEVQQDHPLLLRHVLSGTLADDDLVPALHSRRGGATNPTKSGSRDVVFPDENVSRVAAQGAPEGERLTNFRRGTMVWYLSKAAGVSCPFARVGIRLCEYGKEGRKVAEKHTSDLQPGPNERTNADQVRCGEKRKRVRRGCRRDSDGSRESSSVGRDSQSPAVETGYDEPNTDSDDDERPPKVKLTLRLRPSLPCAPTLAAPLRSREVIDLLSDVTSSSSEDDDNGTDDSDDAHMRSDQPELPWSLPPYPRRSISVPRYTPICDERPRSPSSTTQRNPVPLERRRSPSVPWSASPPPDSDHDDFDADSDVDWDSSSLSVPSPAPLRVKVGVSDNFQPSKHETTDIRDMLAAWEDLDCAPTSTVSSATIKLPTTDDLRFEALELWEWEFESGWNGLAEDCRDLSIVKMEPGDCGCLSSPGFPVSPYSPSTSSSRDSSSSPVCESGVGPFTFQSPLSPLSLPPLPSPSSMPTGIHKDGRALTWQDAELLGPDTVHPHEFEDGWVSGGRLQTRCSLLAQHVPDVVASLSPSVGPAQDASCMAVKELGTCQTVSTLQSPPLVVSGVVVVHTCHPCTPDICATQIEGISVYQTMMGTTLLLRRIDTDFVNLSTILAHLSMSHPSPLPDACVNVSHSSLSISGIWAPLSVARLYARDLPKGVESIFLSDDLVMRFPTALQDFYQQSISWRSLNQFGPHFNASFSSRDTGDSLHIPQLDHRKSAKEEGWEASIESGLVEEPLLTIPPSVNLALAALHPSTSVGPALSEVPLSPTEQEMFRALCIHPDWEMEEVGMPDSGEKIDNPPRQSPTRERPLRRSRRVADAVAARSRAAPPRTKGPWHP